MLIRNARVAAGIFLLAVVLTVPSFVMQSGPVEAQVAPTATATVEPIDPNGSMQPSEMPANPFPNASWQAGEAQSVLDALLRGENIQVDQQPVTLIDADQLQADLAAVHRVWLPQVIRGSNPPGSTLTRTPTPKPDDPDDNDPSADIGVGIWPNPSVRVAQNGSIAYEIRASNFGKGKATNLRVTLPYNKNQIVIYGSTIPGDGDWVSEVTSTNVTFTFSKLDGGEQRKATLFFRVQSGVAIGTMLPMQTTYTWNDSDDGGSGKSNSAPVRVGTQNEASAWALFSVSPQSVKANALQRFSTDRYGPGEGITFWLNLPDKTVRALNETAIADNQGRMTLEIRFRDLPPGSYSLVGQGRRSGVIVVGFFTVTP